MERRSSKSVPKTSVLNLQNEKVKLEKKLQQLRETMKKEKEARRQLLSSYPSKWKSSQVKPTNKDPIEQRWTKPLVFQENAKVHLKVLGNAGGLKPTKMSCKKTPLKKPSKTDKMEELAASSLIINNLSQINSAPLKNMSPLNNSRKSTEASLVIEELKPEVIDDTFKSPNNLEDNLLSGQFNEEESSKYFQEALQEWRSSSNQKSQEVWINPADLEDDPCVTFADEFCQTKEGPDLLAEQPITVTFSDHGSLTFSERLLLQQCKREGPIFPGAIDWKSSKEALLESEASETQDAEAEVNSLGPVFHGLLDFDSDRELALETSRKKTLIAEEPQILEDVDETTSPKTVTIEPLEEDEEEDLNIGDVHSPVIELPDSSREDKSFTSDTEEAIEADDYNATALKPTVEVVALFSACISAVSTTEKSPRAVLNGKEEVVSSLINDTTEVKTSEISCSVLTQENNVYQRSFEIAEIAK